MENFIALFIMPTVPFNYFLPKVYVQPSRIRVLLCDDDDALQLHTSSCVVLTFDSSLFCPTHIWVVNSA